VQQIVAPVDLSRGFLGNEEATSLFKDYIDALYSNDLESVKDHLEPTFYIAA
jgi:hypothetical protein